MGTLQELSEHLRVTFPRILRVELLDKQLHSIHEDVKVHLGLLGPSSPYGILVQNVKVGLDHVGVAIGAARKLTELVHRYLVCAEANKLLKQRTNFAPDVEVDHVCAGHDLCEELLLWLLLLELSLQAKLNERGLRLLRCELPLMRLCS